MAKDFKAVHSRQNNVQHDQIEQRFLCFIQSFFPVVDDNWIVPGFGERLSNVPG